MRNYQRGQILLIVVLVMAIALTVGLSIASRSITDIRTTTDQESSQRAFSAAEAGIEKTLQEPNGTNKILSNNSSYKTSITTVAGTDILLNNGIPVLKDDASDLWLSTYPGYAGPPWNGNVTVYWGGAGDTCTTDETTNTMAALEIVLISGTSISPQLTHYPVDPCAARAAVNSFTVPAAGGGAVAGKTFGFKTTIVVTNGLIMRIMPLYASATIGVRGCDGLGANCTALPFQGKLVTSVGTSQNTQRKLIGFESNPKIPIQIFPFVLFSPK